MASNIHLRTTPDQFKRIYAAINTARAKFELKKKNRGGEADAIDAICADFLGKAPAANDQPEIVTKAIANLREFDDGFLGLSDDDCVAEICRTFLEPDHDEDVIDLSDPPAGVQAALKLMRESNPDTPAAELLDTACALFVESVKRAQAVEANTKPAKDKAAKDNAPKQDAPKEAVATT